MVTHTFVWWHTRGYISLSLRQLEASELVDTQSPMWSSAPFVKDSMSIHWDYFSLSFSSSKDNQVWWHVETNYGHPHPFVNQRQASPLTRRDQCGHLHPLSKTQCLSIETTLVSPFCQPETIKSDDTQRKIMVIHILLSTRGKRARWHAKTNVVVCTFLWRLNVYRPRLL